MVYFCSCRSLPFRFPADVTYEQRLSTESQEQQELIGQLLHRVERLESVIQEQQGQKARQRMWGGFFGMRGLQHMEAA